MRGKKRLQSFVRRLLGCRSIEDYSSNQRRLMWPSVPMLDEKHIKNCSIVKDRYELLHRMPKHGICIELGILKCEFSQKIIESTCPEKLYLVDIMNSATDLAKAKFPDEIITGSIVVRQGDSASIVSELPDASLDWAYVDANHDYEFVKNDLSALRSKVKPEGMIVMNDYTFFAPSAFQKFGVMEAVNEFCHQFDWELVYWALHGRAYYDVAIRQIR